nr:nucleoside recognition domain-containing protein [uncultured Aminipila sp.]
MNMTTNLDSLITYVLYGDFGLLTIVPYFLFKILFPIITSFYLLQLFLLESNLLRIVSLKVDRILNKFGLSSNTLLPLLLGFGCVTVALGALQLTSNKRERRIAQILLCMIVPCSAQLVINTVLIFQTSRHYLIAYILIIFLIFLFLSYILNLLFPNDTFSHCSQSSKCKYKCRYYFFIPKLLPLLFKSLRNSIGFLIETAVPFAIGNIIVSILNYCGYIHKLCIFAAPLFCNFLHLPADSATIFILSIIKKDLGAASLLALFSNGSFTDPQIFICTVMLTLFVPCLASMIILFKHETKLISITIWVLSIFMSLIVGKILSALLILPISS